MKIFTNLRKEHFNLHIHGIFTKAQYTTIFQSTHSHKIRPKFFVTASKPFQSTYPHKMRLDRKNKIALSSVFQSTHPHRIQLQHIKIDTALVQISIHASSQNATAIISTFFAFLYVMCSS